MPAVKKKTASPARVEASVSKERGAKPKARASKKPTDGAGTSGSRKPVGGKGSSRRGAEETTAKGEPIVLFADGAAFDAWLAEHADSASPVWLKHAKKGCATPSVSYSDALDVALTWGWIDGQKGSYDDAFWIQRFGPRGARSIWSTNNQARVAKLARAGAMKPRGMREVEQAKADGRWERAYAPQSRAAVPGDFAAALAKAPRAKAAFEALSAANRYAILFRIHNVKKAETRARKIETFVAMLTRGEVVHR